jgi:phosphatidate phosphatase APP1
VLLFPAVGTQTQVTVSGRVFTEPLGGGTSAVSRNLRSLLAPNWEGAKVSVRYADQTAELVSAKDGSFEATFSAPKDKPFAVGLGRVEAMCKGAATGTADVDVISPDAPFFVVSDFDDTLAVTEVLNKRHLVEHAIGQDGETQPLIEGMPQMMRCLREGKKDRPVFALVSGSPVQFVPRTAKFLFKHDFPPFGLYLRDLGPNTLSDYKQPIIRALMKALPHDVVLVGDSGEHDPEVYAQIRSEFPGRVKAIAIHDVGRLESKDRTKDMMVFKQPRDVMAEMVKLGLMTQGCVEAAFK